MKKHTAGPWEVRQSFYVGVPGDPFSLAEVKSCNTVPADDVEQHEANARLIASAPCLLAACKSARDFVANLRVPQDITQAAWQVMQGSRVLDALNAAIARAEQP